MTSVVDDSMIRGKDALTPCLVETMVVVLWDLLRNHVAVCGSLRRNGGTVQLAGGLTNFRITQATVGQGSHLADSAWAEEKAGGLRRLITRKRRSKRDRKRRAHDLIRLGPGKCGPVDMT